jgi:hypothetical protein
MESTSTPTSAGSTENDLTLAQKMGYESPRGNWLRVKLRGRPRIYLAWAFVFILVFAARQYPTLPGIALCFVGATIRFWASGFLRKDSQLAVGGPYRISRNPLYLGTYLMALGVALSIENYYLLGAMTLLFAVVYHYIIMDEEVKLKEIFGEPYRAYLAAVPRFFPRPWPASREKLRAVNHSANAFQFSWELGMKNRAYEAYVSWIGLIGAVAAIAWAWQNLATTLM